MFSLNPENSRFCKWRTSERLSNLPKSTQPVTGPLLGARLTKQASQHSIEGRCHYTINSPINDIATLVISAMKQQHSLPGDPTAAKTNLISEENHTGFLDKVTLE